MLSQEDMTDVEGDKDDIDDPLEDGIDAEGRSRKIRWPTHSFRMI